MFLRRPFYTRGPATPPPPPPVTPWTHMFRLKRSVQTTVSGNISWDTIVIDENLSLVGPVTTVTVPAGVTRVRLTFSNRADTRDSATFFDSQIQVNGGAVARIAEHNSRFSTFHLACFVPVTPGDTISAFHSGNNVVRSSTNSAFTGVFYA